MDTPSLTAAVRAELLAHPEVSEGTHRFGGIEFRLGRRELGHLHGETLADLPFPRRVRDELVAAGRAAPHHVLPDSGWVSRRVRGPEDVAAVVELFRMSYERAAAQSERGAAA
jgi:luciferase-like monooxygenase